MKPFLKKLIQDAIEAEIGNEPKPEIVETRRDPKVTTTIVVRTKSDGCFVISVFEGKAEVIDTFQLEDQEDSPQTLRGLKVGDPTIL